MREEQSTHETSVALDRRRFRRLDGLGQLQARLLSTSTPTAVRDLSLAGIALETVQAIETDSRHRLLIRGVAGTTTVELTARAIHCLRLGGPRGLTIYLVGFAFGPMDHPSREALRAIFDEVHALGSAADRAVSHLPSQA
jgi:hypothetical protein